MTFKASFAQGAI